MQAIRQAIVKQNRSILLVENIVHDFKVEMLLVLLFEGQQLTLGHYVKII